MSPSTMTTYKQFATFSNDTAGLERIFRFLQSCVQIVLAYPSATSTICQLSHLFQCTGKLSTFLTRSVLLALQQRLDVARRYIRVFRFLSVFQQAQQLLMSREHTIVSSSHPKDATNPPSVDKKVEQSSTPPSAPHSPRQPKKVEEWLDRLGLTLTGVYLLTESSTIIDYMQIDGLQVWGPERYLVINAEAQRFWFLALLCGVLSALLRVWRILTTSGEHVSRGRPETLIKLVRGAVTNTADMVLPGVIIGWLDVSPGVVALVMCATTLSTSVDIWERCGREIPG